LSAPADGHPGRVAVGDLTFDPESGELTGPAGVRRIPPQPASLLTLLAVRQGEVVTRDQIRQRLWPGGKVEFEQGIAFAVREIRKAIESVGGDPAMVETVPKRGFRIITTTPSAGADPTPTAPSEHAGFRRVPFLPLSLFVVIAAIGVGLALTREPAATPPAVVVFAHETEDARLADLVRAVGFELTAALTRANGGRLGVVGPTGTTTLSGPNDTEGARASLAACLVVSGAMRVLGRDSVIVFTQVVRTVDRVHAWASQDTASVARAATAVVPRVVGGVASAAAGC